MFHPAGEIKVGHYQPWAVSGCPGVLVAPHTQSHLPPFSSFHRTEDKLRRRQWCVPKVKFLESSEGGIQTHDRTWEPVLFTRCWTASISKQPSPTCHLRNKHRMTHNSLASSLETTVQLYLFLVKASLLKSASFWHGGFQFLLCKRPSVRFQNSLKTTTLMTDKINQIKFFFLTEPNFKSCPLRSEIHRFQRCVILGRMFRKGLNPTPTFLQLLQLSLERSQFILIHPV